jgi:branched-chain amino acid transport system permease protein
MENFSSNIMQCVITGIMMGSVYALIAFGFNITSGIVRVTNFSHGMFVVTGMFLTITLCTAMTIDPYLALLLTLPICFIIGAVVEKVFVHPILNAPKINQFILTLALKVFLENCLLLFYGGDFRGLTTWYTSKSIIFESINVSINYSQLFAFIATALGLFGITYLLYFSRLGKQMRAVADDKEAAALLGTNVWSIYTIAFGLAALLAALSGAASISYMVVAPSDGNAIVIKAFIVTIFGGPGSILGTILGGLFLGLLENIGVLIVGPSMATAFALIGMIIFILARPQGLLGKKIN